MVHVLWKASVTSNVVRGLPCITFSIACPSKDHFYRNFIAIIPQFATIIPIFLLCGTPIPPPRGWWIFASGGGGHGSPCGGVGGASERAPVTGTIISIGAKGTRRKFLSTMIDVKCCWNNTRYGSHQSLCVGQQVCSCPFT